MDGLTTNGVLVMHPKGGFTEESKPGVWREISVCGDVYTLRETRSAQTPGKLVSNWSITEHLKQMLWLVVMMVKFMPHETKCACDFTLCRWRTRAIFCRTAPWWIYVELLCCGALPKASSTLPPKSIWRLSGRRSMQHGPNALWVSTRSPSLACSAAAPSPLWRTSSPGSTWPVVTCTVTTTGATAQSRSPTLSGSVPCAGW